MRLTEEEIENFMNLWMAVKPYITAKDKFEACQKFIMTLEDLVDIEECSSEFVGFDGTVDKVIRNNYTTHIELEDSNEDDDW